MGDIQGLVDKVSELGLDENEELVKKLQHGKHIHLSLYIENIVLNCNSLLICFHKHSSLYSLMMGKL